MFGLASAPDNERNYALKKSDYDHWGKVRYVSDITPCCLQTAEMLKTHIFLQPVAPISSPTAVKKLATNRLLLLVKDLVRTAT
jgi:hypothetical protein